MSKHFCCFYDILVFTLFRREHIQCTMAEGDAQFSINIILGEGIES